MTRISALITGLALVPICGALAEPPRYSVQILPIVQLPGMSLRELGDGATVLGKASCPFLWSDGVFRFAPMVCSQDGFEVMVPGNVAAGARHLPGVHGSRVPATFDGSVVTDLPTLIDPFEKEPWGVITDGTSPTDLVGNALGQPARWINGELTLLPLPEGCQFGPAIAVNAHGVILGQNCPSDAASLWTDGKVSTLPYPAPIDPPAEGFLYYRDTARDINDAGMILVERRYIVEIDAGDEMSVFHSLLFDGAAWHELPEVARELTNDGSLLGTWSASGGPGRRAQTFVWNNGQYFLLETLINDHRQDASLIDAHPDGRLLVSLVGGGLPDAYAILIPTPPVPPVCRVDWDGNGVVNSTDVAFYINDWFENQATGECP